MNNIKSYILLCFFILLSCSWANAALEVVTTTTDLRAIVQSIGKDRVRVVSIAKGDEDPHFVEPRPSYMITLGRAKLLFCIGLDLEIWLKPLLEGSRNFAIQIGGAGYVDCSQAVNVKEIPKVRVDPSMGDVHPLGNPHYWLDPENGVRIAALVAQKLSEVDPAGSAEYNKNFQNFKNDIESRIPAWKERFARLKNTNIACFHSSWIYFADAFGLKIVGYVEPRPGVPPTGRELASLVSAMKHNNCRIILREQYHSDRFANMAAEKAGGKVLVMPASVEAEPQIKTYADLIDTIVTRVSEALKEQQENP